MICMNGLEMERVHRKHEIQELYMFGMSRHPSAISGLARATRIACKDSGMDCYIVAPQSRELMVLFNHTSCFLLP